jgi:hypothetical protein
MNGILNCAHDMQKTGINQGEGVRDQQFGRISDPVQILGV